MPAAYQGTLIRTSNQPILNLQPAAGITREMQRREIDMIQSLNAQHVQQQKQKQTSELEARIASYELAFQLQMAAPEALDLASETEDTLQMYGIHEPKPDWHPMALGPSTFGRQCLIARRMVERGVRVVQILHRGWDQHGNIANDLPAQCRDVDQACSALIQDLKQKGLLDSTLVVWGGEFGRTVYCQGGLTKENYGRDHHPKCFTMWMAGGGIRGGVEYGVTDDFSYNILEKPVHVNDLNATILHCMGIDHERFIFPFQGLEQRLTGVEHQQVIQELLA
jgi:uncharacterized protein (DUF1501 family)